MRFWHHGSFGLLGMAAHQNVCSRVDARCLPGDDCIWAALPGHAYSPWYVFVYDILTIDCAVGCAVGLVSAYLSIILDDALIDYLHIGSFWGKYVNG